MTKSVHPVSCLETALPLNLERGLGKSVFYQNVVSDTPKR